MMAKRGTRSRSRPGTERDPLHCKKFEQIFESAADSHNLSGLSLADHWHKEGQWGLLLRHENIIDK